MLHTEKFVAGFIFATCVSACSRSPGRVTPPKIDPERAAIEAIRLYDTDKDGSLNAAEIKKCPGMLVEIKSYDRDGNGLVSREEIAARIQDLRKHGIGLTRLNCDVTANGRGLKDATIEFEPEPY